MAYVQGHASYTIHGVKVQFPCKPYPSQFSMMERIIKGIVREQNCLLESPTGSGKSLALLCSTLAWQQAEADKIKEEEENEKDIDCECRREQTKPDDACCAGSTEPSVKAVKQDVRNTQDNVDESICNGDGEDDFKVEAKKFRTPKSGGLPVVIQYEDEDGIDASPVPGQAGPSPDLPAGGSSTCTDEHCCCECHADGATKKKRKLPKIYFGTRTHKQIAQIARELGKTAYRHVKMTILSSREHTCIHPQVASMPNKTEECKNRLENFGCRFQDRVKFRISHRNMQDQGLDSAWDLEDFVAYCKKQKACPYYGVRQLKETAELILCPYNYLVDPLIRKSMEINLKGQIVILDEAHNIEDSSREAASYKVTEQQLIEAAQDLHHMVDGNIKPLEHAALRDMINSFGKLIDHFKEQLDTSNYDQASRVWSGTDMVANLQIHNITPDKCKYLHKCLASVSEDIGEGGKKKEEQLSKLHSATLQVVEGLLLVMDFIFRDNMKYMEAYRIALMRTMEYTAGPTENRWMSKRRRGAHRQLSYMFNLHFWCLNPAVAFSELGELCRSVLLTSGTLSPMDTFQSELGVAFPIQLEAGHVVGSSQVWVGTISQGPRGSHLLGSYRNAETFQYQDDIGELLLNICKTIPHGVLCFLPSYKSVEKLSTRWQTTGLWARLEEYKRVFVEPRASDKVDFDELMKEFYQTINETKDLDDDTSGGITGGLFLAVCRGKVSEGMDFADDNARAVIAVSIPYPNFKDRQIELKKEYNNRHSRTRGLLDGSSWYEIQAFRALNQALGRCIRHRNDWGALILVDQRYGKNPQKYVKGLSKWVRNKVRYFANFQQANYSLQQFTKDRKENPMTMDISLMTTQCSQVHATKKRDDNSTINNRCVNTNDTVNSTIDSRYLTIHEEPENSQSSSSVATDTAQQSTTKQQQQFLQTNCAQRFFNISQAGGFLPSQLTPQMGKENLTSGSNQTNLPRTLSNGDVIASSTQAGLLDTKTNTSDQTIEFNPPMASTQLPGVRIKQFVFDTSKIQSYPVLASTPRTALKSKKSKQLRLDESMTFSPMVTSTQLPSSAKKCAVDPMTSLNESAYFNSTMTSQNPKETALIKKCFNNKKLNTHDQIICNNAISGVTMTTAGIEKKSTDVDCCDLTKSCPDDEHSDVIQEDKGRRRSSGFYRFFQIDTSVKVQNAGDDNNTIKCNSRPDSPDLFEEDDELGGKPKAQNEPADFDAVVKEISGTDGIEIVDLTEAEQSLPLEKSTVEKSANVLTNECQPVTSVARRPLFKRSAKRDSVRTDVNTCDEHCDGPDDKNLSTEVAKTETGQDVDTTSASDTVHTGSLLEAALTDSVGGVKSGRTSKSQRRLSTKSRLKSKTSGDVHSVNGDIKIEPQTSTPYQTVLKNIKSDDVKAELENELKDNSSVGNSHIKPEEDVLKTKRSRGSKRRRQSNIRVTPLKKVKSEEPELQSTANRTEQSQSKKQPGETVRVVCDTCGTKLAELPASCLPDTEKHTPNFVTELYQNEAPRGILVGHRHDLVPDTTIVLKAKKMALNSLWNEEDGCCVQLRTCAICSDLPLQTVVAADVKVVRKESHKNLLAGQVWFLPGLKVRL